jgi:hypothetical protein
VVLETMPTPVGVDVGSGKVTLTLEQRRYALQRDECTLLPSQSTDLFHIAVSDFVKERDAVGLGPQSYLSSVGER